ncbi:MAG: hypothetical protein MMC33_004105 [Icmadophila ericetorum]|nr:hypothetical protein [Icmadophila ericetorum]
MRQWLSSPAVNQKRECSYEEEQTYIKGWFFQQPEVDAWNECWIFVLEKIYTVFQLSGNVSADSIFRQIRARNLVSSSSGSSSSSSLISPTTLQLPKNQNDPDEWRQKADTLTPVAGDIAPFFSAFLKRRVNIFGALRAQIAKHFKKQWLAQTEPVDNETKRVRQAVTRHVPDVIKPAQLHDKRPFSDIERKSFVVIPDEAIPAPLVYETPTDDDITSNMINEAEAEESANEIDVELPAEIDEDILAERHVLKYLDQVDDDVDLVIDVNHDSPADEDIPSVEAHRLRLMELWHGMTDINRKPSLCPLCEFSWADSGRAQPSARLCTHLVSKPTAYNIAHGSLLGVYMDDRIVAREHNDVLGTRYVFQRSIFPWSGKQHGTEQFAKHLKSRHARVAERLV